MAGSLLCAALAIFISASPVFAASQKQIMGRVERAIVLPGQLLMKARLDSGAKTTSIHATKIFLFEKEGQPWVRFQIKGNKGPGLMFERKVVRVGNIKKKAGGTLARPVVWLEICLGMARRTVEVNLANRSGFNYPLLIGRNFLAGTVLIDSELLYTAEPQCSS